MKRIEVCCLTLALAVGAATTGTAIAETVAPAKTAKPKQSKRATAKKSPQRLEQERLEQAKAQAQAEQQARRQAEAEAKAERDAEILEQEKRIREADALVKAGKPAQAYELLEPMEFERSGEVRYDYLLGIAALDSGKADKATLAFERVLAVDPNFAGARLDMARAYYQLGDLPRAKTEFEIVLKSNPPQAARATVEKYLAAIDAQMRARDTQVTGYLEGTAGHDSNVNTSTAVGQVTLPAFGNLPFTLSQSSMKQEDYYLGGAGGIGVMHPVNETVAVFAGADLRHRANTVLSQFDSTNLSGNAGGLFTLGKQDSLRLGLNGGQYSLGSVRYYDNSGVSGEWRHAFSPANQVSVFGLQSYYRFVDSARFTGMQAQNFDQGVVGGSWQHVMPDGRSMVFGGVFFGQERDVSGLRPDGAKRFNGLRAGGQAQWSDNVEWFGSVGWNDGNYARQNALFLVNRRDVLYDATAGINWRWDKLWSLRPQVVLAHNQSNIPIYGYDRVDFSVSVRRDFE